MSRNRNSITQIFRHSRLQDQTEKLTNNEPVKAWTKIPIHNNRYELPVQKLHAELLGTVSFL